MDYVLKIVKMIYQEWIGRINSMIDGTLPQTLAWSVLNNKKKYKKK